MTPDLNQIRKELSRRSLKDFIRLLWPLVEAGSPLVDGWAIDAICDHLAALTNRQINNLLINCPPRIGKSNIVGVFFPAWWWIHNPATTYFYTSYAMGLAERDSVKCRRLIESDLYQQLFGDVFSLAGDENTKRRFSNNKSGYRLVGSIGGTVTGEGGVCCVCDDPHSVTDVESEVEKKKCITWFDATFLNRLNPGGLGRIVIGQRIARDDLSGHILENYKDWTHLCLPYEYRASVSVPTKIGWKDPRTEEGEPLWPERFTTEDISQYKRNPKTWSSQYLQNPIDVANALFKPDCFRYYDHTATSYTCNGKEIKKSDCYRMASADLAISQDRRGDYTAIAVVDIATTGEIILLDMIRERFGETRIVNEMLKVNEMYAPDYFLVEDVGFQSLFANEARQAGLPVRGIKPDNKTKEIRSIPLQARFELGQVWFPKEMKWVRELEQELMEFPEGRYKDRTDSLAYAAIEASRRFRTPAPPEEPKPAQPDQREIYKQALMQGLRW